MIAIVLNMNKKSKNLIQFVTFFSKSPSLASSLEPEPSESEPSELEPHLIAALAQTK
jgi:hypothetical protein